MFLYLNKKKLSSELWHLNNVASESAQKETSTMVPMETCEKSDL